MDRHDRTRQNIGRLAVFYLLALTLSWAFWAPLVAARFGWMPAASPLLHLAGSLGPAAAALIVMRWSRPVLRGGYVQTIWPRGSGAGLAMALGLALAIGATGLLVEAIVTGTTPMFGKILTSKEFPTWSAGMLVIANLVFYGFGEEIGWRGFALPIVLRLVRPLTAALLMTIPWAFWHLPLLVANDTYQSLGLAGLFGWAISLLTGSILLTWLYLRSAGSVVVVAFFHAAIDLVMVNPAVGLVGINVMGGLVTMAGIGAAADLLRKGRMPASPAPS